MGTVVTGLALLACGSTSEGAGTGGSNSTAGTTSGGSSGAAASGAANQGGTSTGESGSTGSGTSGSANAGTSNGSAGTSASGGSGTGGAGSSTATIGSLQVIRTLSGAGSTLSSARFNFKDQAAWAAYDAAQPDEPCTTETYGDCVLSKCPTDPTDPNAPEPTDLPSSDHLDAGTITMLADMGTFSRTGTPTATDHGYSFDTTGSISGQEIVTVSATGGSIAAFTGKVQVPFTPLLLTPSLEGSKGSLDVPVPRTADFTFTWDARGASQKLQLVTTESTTATASNFLICNFDVQSGTGTFKAGALSQLAVGTRFRIFGVNSAIIETPQGPVALLAAFEMSSADKMAYPSFVLE